MSENPMKEVHLPLRVDEVVSTDNDSLRSENANIRARVAEFEAMLSDPTALGVHVLKSLPDYRLESAEYIGRLRALAERALLERAEKAEARVAELKGEIERGAWVISPAMAQARIDQLSARVAKLDAAPKIKWQTGIPDVPAGGMKRLWCAVRAPNGKICHSVLCFSNGRVMPLADWVDTVPDCCKPVPGSDDGFAWFGWYEESCDHCETRWHTHANVVAWMELPKFAELQNAELFELHPL